MNSVVLLGLTFLTVVYTVQSENQNWVKDKAVHVVLGPKDAVYCRVQDPRGSALYDGFGRCNVALEKVTADHAGTWRMNVGLPGRVLTDEQSFNVYVSIPEAKEVVTTSVEKDQTDKSVHLTCSVAGQRQVRACKFREPSGRVLLATPGVNEDRYQAYGAETSFRSTVNDQTCGLHITNPMTSDLGLWRCAMETEEDTYYGFLTVLCPWAMMDPEVAAAVVSEPILTPETETVNGVEGFSVTLSCSIDAPIEYCYFRSRNGTTFVVGEGTSTDTMEYSGKGFDAGECGVRFRGLTSNESGRWSCHVGTNNEEQRANLEVTVKEPMSVVQYHSENELIVEGRVYNQRSVDYCRFVRIDGFGFTSKNTPEGYESDGSTSHGHCNLRVANPTILDHHPWTVAARINGQDVEISGATTHTIEIPPENTNWFKTHLSRPCFWVTTIIIVALVATIVLLSRKKHRKWASSKMSSIRNSFRNSTVKKPLPDLPENNVNNTTSMAA